MRGWDPKQKKEIVGRSRGPATCATGWGRRAARPPCRRSFGGTERITVRVAGVEPGGGGRRWRSGLLNEMALGHITGEGVCIGRADLRAGQV